MRDVRPMLEPVEAETVSDVAAANDVRAVALMTLGIVELWAGAGDDAERHLEEALELARRNGRPYVEHGLPRPSRRGCRTPFPDSPA